MNSSNTKTPMLNTSSSIRMDEFKRRARAQWSANPCGAQVGSDLEFGTREYFDAIERDRYVQYAPWIKRAVGFNDYPGQRLLEVGFGTGTDLLQFARGGAIVTGVDLTPRSIEIARKRFAVYGLTAEFTIGDAENLGFPDASFDVVYSFGVLHHTPDTRRAVREIHRVLRPGGKAIVMLYHRASLYYFGSIILKHGLLHRELFKHTIEEIMSRHVEYSDTDSRPLVRVFSRSDARRIFNDFRECKFHVNQLTRGELGQVGRMLPEAFYQWLARNFGWNLLITATK